jgi:hypothetical protein
MYQLVITINAMYVATSQKSQEPTGGSSLQFCNKSALDTLHTINAELKKFRDERSSEWQHARLWSIPKDATPAERDQFRVLSERHSLAEQLFWHSFIKDQCGAEAKCSYLFSALHPPDLYYQYNPECTKEQIGHWDYIDYAFSRAVTGQRIGTSAQESLKTCNIENAHLIPKKFHFGDTGWSCEQEVARYASYLKQAARRVRIIGAILHPNSQSDLELFRSDPIGAEVIMGSYDFVFINYSFSHLSGYRLARMMLRPEGFLVTTPHSFNHSGRTVSGLVPQLKGTEMKYHLYQKSAV